MLTKTQDPLLSRKKKLLERLKLQSLHALKHDYIPPALLDTLRVSVMIQHELYFFDDNCTSEEREQKEKGKTEDLVEPCAQGIFI